MADGTLPDFSISIDDEELIFDDGDMPPLPAAALPEPAAQSVVTEAAKPRRAPRRGRAATAETAETAPPAEAEAAPVIDPPSTASAVAPVAPAEKPAGKPGLDPRPESKPAGSPKRDTILLAVVALSLLTSLLSLGGLIAIGRTLAHAQADRARAEEDSAALARVPQLVQSLDQASARLTALAARAPAGQPATVADVQKTVDDLRVALAAHQPDGQAALTGVMHDGFTELGLRIDRLSGQHGGGPTVRVTAVGPDKQGRE